MSEKSTKQPIWQILISSFLGGVICIFADLALKQDASAIITFGNYLRAFLKLPHIWVIICILILAIGLAFIFEPASKKVAFYLGASVLAICFTIVPYRKPLDLQTIPHSGRVDIHVEGWQEVPSPSVAVQPRRINVTVRSDVTKRVIGSSTFIINDFHFYLDPGQYIITIEIPGYKMGLLKNS